jgi:hypothetical protein
MEHEPVRAIVGRDTAPIDASTDAMRIALAIHRPDDDFLRDHLTDQFRLAVGILASWRRGIFATDRQGRAARKPMVSPSLTRVSILCAVCCRMSSAGRHFLGSPNSTIAEPPNLKTDFSSPR